MGAKFDLSNNRKTFSKIPSFIDVPDLLSIQTKAYQQFLQEWIPYEARNPIGLEGVFKDVFPIEDSHKNYILEYKNYYLGQPKYSSMNVWIGVLHFQHLASSTCIAYN